MFRAIIIATILTASISCMTGSAQAETVKQRIARMKRESAKSRAKFDADFKKRSSELDKKFAEADKAREDRKKEEANKERLKIFNPSGAPRPEVCFNSFLKKARAATSFEEILPYLPMDDREHYKRRQREYDPKIAAEKRKRYQAEGELDEKAIAHLTNPPYTNALRHYKAIAEKVRKFESSKIDGNKANLYITIHASASFNGVGYTKGTATVGMVGEGKYWYFDTFKEGTIVRR